MSGAPTMWCKNASGAGTHELSGRWSTSSVEKNVSVVNSLIFLLYSVWSLNVHGAGDCAKPVAAKETIRTKHVTRRFISGHLIISKTGDYTTTALELHVWLKCSAPLLISVISANQW